MLKIYLFLVISTQLNRVVVNRNVRRTGQLCFVPFSQDKTNCWSIMIFLIHCFLKTKICPPLFCHLLFKSVALPLKMRKTIPKYHQQD